MSDSRKHRKAGCWVDFTWKDPLSQAKSKDFSTLSLQREEDERLALAVNRTKENANGLSAANWSFLWQALDFTAGSHGQ